MACLYAANPEYVKGKYNLAMLREVENLVAEAVEVNVPFMNPITYAHFLPVETDDFIHPTGDTVHSLTRPVSMPRQSSTIRALMKFLSLRTSVSRDMCPLGKVLAIVDMGTQAYEGEIDIG